MPKFRLTHPDQTGFVLHDQPGAGLPLATPPLGFIDPLEALESAHELIANGWKDLLAGKAGSIRSEAIGQAVIAAATGSTLPFPLGFVAGLAGKQIIPPGSLSYTEYVALSLALQNASIKGRAITGVLKGFGGRVLKFATGPTGLLVTGASTIIFKVTGPPQGEGSIAVEVIRGLTTFGIEDTSDLPPNAVPLPLGFYVLEPDQEEPGTFELTELLQLVPFWTKDP